MSRIIQPVKGQALVVPDAGHGFWGRTPMERDRLRRGYELVLLTSLRPWKDNPRFNADAVPRVAGLIKEHGFAGVLVATPDGVIRAGHTRHAALQLLQADEEYMPGDPNRTKVWVHWKNFASEQKATDYALSDNKAGEWADWDHAKLSNLFKRRNKVDIAELAQATGFKQQEIEWQGPKPIDVDKLGAFEVVEDIHVIRIGDVKSSDKDSVMEKITAALEGTGYAPKLY